MNGRRSFVWCLLSFLGFGWALRRPKPPISAGRAYVTLTVESLPETGILEDRL